MQQSWYTLISNYFKDYPAWAVELGAFGITSLILGFLCKSFGKTVAILVLLITVLFAGLWYLQLMPESFLINLKLFVGLQETSTLHDVPAVFIPWAREHVIACVSAVVGFVVGYKLG